MQYTATASRGTSVSFAIETLPQAFASLPDPRRTQGRRYSVAAILSLAWYCAIPRRMLIDLHDTPLAIGVYALGAPDQVQARAGAALAR